MSGGKHRACIAVFSLVCSAVHAQTPDLQRGRDIYLRGVYPTTPDITATVGQSQTPIPAALFPCSNCHGTDGRGRTEGGVTSADIRPATLNRPLSGSTRSRPAYDAPHLKRAIGMGMDSAGNRLDPAMPRFQLSQAQAADLLAFLSVMDCEKPPGVADDSVRIGIVGSTDLASPAQRIYDRRLVLVPASEADLFLILDVSSDAGRGVRNADHFAIPTIARCAPNDTPGPNAFVVGATTDREVELLTRHAQSRGLVTRIFRDNCTGIDSVGDDTMALLTSTAVSHCDIDRIPASLGQRIAVALPYPPAAENAPSAAQALLDLVRSAIASAGRDLTREKLHFALEHVDFTRSGMPPDSKWAPDRHTAARSVWISTLDTTTQTLTGEPGWSGVEK